MSCKSYITWLSRNVGGTGFSRTELLEAVNNAQLQILGQDLRMMRVLPDPFLATTASTYLYPCSTSIYDSIGGVQGSLSGDIRKVSRIYTHEATTYGILNDYGKIRSDHAPTYLQPSGSNEMDIPFDFVQSAGPGKADAKIILWHQNNPGTTTATYRGTAYKWPSVLTSEAQDIAVPVNYQRTLLYYTILSELEQSEYGNVNYTLQQKEYWMKDFLSSQSDAPTVQGTATPVRPC